MNVLKARFLYCRFPGLGGNRGNLVRRLGIVVPHGELPPPDAGITPKIENVIRE